MTQIIQDADDPPAASKLATAAAIAAVVLGLTLGYDIRYAAVAIGAGAALGLIIFKPWLGFLAMLLLSTGWPYYAGVPYPPGADVPLPIMLPVIGVTFVSVVVRQLLGLMPPQAPDPRMRLVDIGVALLTVALIISILVNGNFAVGFKAFFRVAFAPLLLYWICRYFVRDTATTRAGFDALLIGSCIGSAYAVFEWFAGYNPMLETFAPPVGDLANHGYYTATLANYKGLYRSHGFGMNPIFFGATSSILLNYATARFATAQKRTTRLLYLVLGTICCAGLISTFSRGPILACAIGILLLAVAYRPLRVYVITAALAGSLVIGYQYMSENSLLKERLDENDNVTLRVKLWETAYAMFTDNPIFGVGLNGFPDHQLEVIRTHRIGPFFEMGDGRLETVKTAEEAFLQFLAEAGLVGGAAAAVLIFAVGRIYVPLLFKNAAEPERMLIVAAGTGLVVFLSVGLTVTIYNAWETACLVPFLLAALVNVRTLRREDT